MCRSRDKSAFVYKEVRRNVFLEAAGLLTVSVRLIYFYLRNIFPHSSRPALGPTQPPLQ